MDLRRYRHLLIILKIENAKLKIILFILASISTPVTSPGPPADRDNTFKARLFMPLYQPSITLIDNRPER